jgi:hypothetical protein
VSALETIKFLLDESNVNLDLKDSINKYTVFDFVKEAKNKELIYLFYKIKEEKLKKEKEKERIKKLKDEELKQKEESLEKEKKERILKERISLNKKIIFSFYDKKYEFKNHHNIFINLFKNCENYESIFNKYEGVNILF